jgi:hypothetical protein
MTIERGVRLPRSSPSKGQDDKDDLGFPREGDPGSFVHAFLAVTRDWDVGALRPLRRRQREKADDLGLPVESDPGDFACAFLSVRDHQQSGRR